ncbi:hypothetical protein VUR80DRAFT_6891 [Thermomyces stellatus]
MLSLLSPPGASGWSYALRRLYELALRLFSTCAALQVTINEKAPTEDTLRLLNGTPDVKALVIEKINVRNGAEIRPEVIT